MYNNGIKGVIIAVGLAGATFTAVVPADAANVGVQVNGVGMGFTVGEGHYYNNRHARQAYTYPSDWKTYHHPQRWYRSHPRWNDQHSSDWYRH